MRIDVTATGIFYFPEKYNHELFKSFIKKMEELGLEFVYADVTSEKKAVCVFEVLSEEVCDDGAP